MVRDELGLKVGLLNPKRKHAAELQGIADFYWYIGVGMLRDAQFPSTLNDAVGVITKPSSW